MLQVHQNIYNEAEHQIDLDLSRTFPHHPFFRHANSKGREQLKRILIAFSWRSPYISYTQSMNYIVAMLLLHCDEETAFWLFVELVEEILPKNFYNPQLTGVRIDSRALDELIKNRLPKMHAHFQKLKLDCTAFSSGWFMRVFVDIFPIETTMRILDLVFAEGNKILFRTVLSYLKIYESHLLEMDNMGDVLHFINSDPCTMYDHIKLTKNMFLFYRLTRQVCLSLRTKYKELIEKEDEELENRRRMLKNNSQI
ncbi:hypothetical protein C9374_013682 [Naegleria lovaniensis]|uniref:Rab-GAP TBC domain-containing protein n=1 Tax=Naegleria lovaniensis TaxID=51637 RepID=A0AA88GDN4_NAELO|nr:uncharacterized protein C9374_013682 [Naegleria lovaniensis]KAG2372674.1 hypothetical protein C9374_013682 [Naegleria lovaniensis]